MQSTAKNVTAYLDEVPAERKAVLTKLRDLCYSSPKGFEESMKYGGPCYSRNGEVEVLALAGCIFMLVEGHRLHMCFVWVYILLSGPIAISVMFPLFLIARQITLSKLRVQQSVLIPQG